MNKVFIFYFCDKSRDMRRIHRVFADTTEGKKALAECIINNVEDGTIELNNSANLIWHTCIYGSPIYLNDSMTYGFIESEYVVG